MPRPETPLSAWCAARGLRAPDLARLTGCSLRSAERWLAGEQVPGPAFRERLYRATGLGVSPSDYPAQAQALLAALAGLEAALRPFAEGSVASRDYLRQAVDPSRVARVTNLAQLLFDEEAFADWLLLDSALGGEDS